MFLKIETLFQKLKDQKLQTMQLYSKCNWKNVAIAVFSFSGVSVVGYNHDNVYGQLWLYILA